MVGLHDTYTSRCGPSSITRRTALGVRPERGGSTKTTSGRGTRSSSGRTLLRDIADDELGVRDAVSLGVSRAPAIDSAEISMPYTAAAPRRGQQADRAGAAVEIPDDVVGPERRELDRDRVQPLGHHGVGLHERARAHLELEPADALAEPVAADQHGLLEADRDLGHAGVDRVHHADDARRQELGQPVGAGDLARRGHEHRQQLAGAYALAHDQVAQVARAAALVVGGQAELARPLHERAADVV